MTKFVVKSAVSTDTRSLVILLMRKALKKLSKVGVCNRLTSWRKAMKRINKGDICVWSLSPVESFEVGRQRENGIS